MLTFSYTISPSLKNEVFKIDAAREKILLERVGRSVELQMRWEAGLDRATQVSRLTSEKLKRQDVLDAINPVQIKNAQNKKYAEYVRAFEWINQNFYLTPEKISLASVKKVYSYFTDKYHFDEKQLADALEFIQVNPEHPIVQAGLAYILVSSVLGANTNGIKLSIIVSNMFLYKNGYDFRGLLNLEEFLNSDTDHFNNLVYSALRDRNMSSYLEYFTAGVAIAAEHALRRITNREFKNDLPASFYNLTERQKDIMILFAKPGVKVSNKTVQKEFGISQITASRDLAKLYALGLIFSAGKGRSVYYTRI